MAGELKVLIVYYSQTGNTEKAAEAIRRGLERENIKPVVNNISEPPYDYEGVEDYDLVIIGSGVSHFEPPKPMQNWTMDALNSAGRRGNKPGVKIPGKNGVVFVTHSGPHTGINEAIPAALWLASFLEHIGFDVRAEWYTVSEFRGVKFPPCQDACPINQDVPWYIALIAKGQLDDAIEVIRKENPLPCVCSRVCTHPCQDKCEDNPIRNMMLWGSKPVSIRALKRFAADYEVGMKKDILPPYKVTKDEKVAIVGSGPAGLTAAHYLSLTGYKVTIFEASPVAGGMLALGIPGYRLPKKILQREIDAIVKAGVDIRLNTRIAKDLTIGDLQKDGYQAIFIATGAHESRKLDIPGQNLKGVINGLLLLRDINLGKEAEIEDKVVVIGGGNVAIDSARSALRLGAREVTIACLESADCMLASPEDIGAAKEEGIAIHNSETCARIVGDDGHVSGVECLGVKWFEFDDAGKLNVECIEGSEHILPADTVIIAIGQLPELGVVEGVGGIKTTKQHAIGVDPETFETAREGIFAGGDVVSGPATVIEAMATGKEVAKAIDCYLRGEKYNKQQKTFNRAPSVERVVITTKDQAKLRPELERLPVAMRTRNFNEVELGFTPRLATMEAMRCLRCDLAVSWHEGMRLNGMMGDTTGRPNEHDLAVLEDRAAGLAKWLLQEAKIARDSH